jgi:hypothetical protein
MKPSENREDLLFALALETPVNQRPAFLDTVCAHNPALRQRLAALLAVPETTKVLLAIGQAAPRPTSPTGIGEGSDEAVGHTLGRYKLLVGTIGPRAVNPTRKRLLFDPGLTNSAFERAAFLLPNVPENVF